MNGWTTNQQSRDGRPLPAVRHVPFACLYRWDVHRISDGRHREGPSGTCTTEDSARACIEAVLSAAAVGPGAYAWGLLSRLRPAPAREPGPVPDPEPASSWSRAPLAWAAPGPDGRVAWLPVEGPPYVAQDTGAPRTEPGEDVPVLLARFGGRLQWYRQAAGLTRAELAEQLQCAPETVGHVENARQIPSRSFAQCADRVLGACGELATSWPALIQSACPDWFWPIVELEEQASFIQEFETAAVPGLLQTEAYARALFTAAHPLASSMRIEQLVAARVDRQRLLTRREPPQIMVVVDEGVLRRRIGGSTVLSEQLGHLLRMSALPKVHLQIVPLDVREHPGGMTSFRLMGFRDGPDLLYGETFICGQTTVEPQQVQRHKLAFSLIQSAALSPDRSRALLRRLKEKEAHGPA
ncbi:Scr1 family TA system antitoxin-like transcriptional regulator [Streptomyces sp. NPDC046831]|uniref:helix-turn-helix domain-containing protein n=1 Tax=Streptomyces sp. NPDC046831 TaxID=3154805 RepID=UPI0033F40ECE